MSSLQDHDPVLERLKALRERSKAAGRVYQYVASEHDTPCSASDVLHTLRLDDDLAVELRDNGGRTVVCALTGDAGESRYPVWEHSSLAPKIGGDARSKTIERLRDVKERLDERSPRVRLREETPLEGLEAPAEWDRNRSAGRTYNGP